MKRLKWVGVFAVVAFALAVYFVLRSEHALVAHPKGIIARHELDLIITNISLMLVIVIPTFAALFFVIWKYHAKKKKTKRDLEHRSKGIFHELLLWTIPSIIVAVMAPVTWFATHKLDPSQPIKSDVKPLTIQVVALDWKWLFIYPEQGIATVNFVQFPERTPIQFKLSADGSPMNSFWIPQLGGQIYCMTGMITPLHLMADEAGSYAGRAAEINGRGLADMTFVAKATSVSEFQEWVSSVKHSSSPLTDQVYSELVKPSSNHPVSLYSSVEEGLFEKIVMKYEHP
jgi:cytochrome o ubiquinol oxidase subunit 2